MKKTLALLIALSMMLAIAPTFAAAEDVVITVATWDATTTPYLIASKEAFEASHPGMKIEYIDVTSQDYHVKVGAMLAGGDTVDVVDIKELSNMETWSEAGFLEPLDDYVAASSYDMDHYVGMDACYVGADGKQYSLPYRSDFWVLYYNKTLFDNAGVEYPTNDMTWEEYADLARKMTSGTEGVDKVWGTHYHTWLSAAVNWAVCGGDYKLADGVYDNLKYYYDLVLGLEDEGVCMSYPDTKAANLHYRGGFEAGNIAMLPMGYWFVSTLIGDIALGDSKVTDFSFVSVPHAEGVPAGSSFGSPTGCAMNVNSQNKEAAWEFISWRCSEEGAKAFASTGTRPAYVSEDVAKAMASADGFPQDDNALAALLPTAVALEWTTGPSVAEMKTIVNEEHTNIMTRTVTVEEGIQAMNERVAELAE